MQKGTLTRAALLLGAGTLTLATVEAHAQGAEENGLADIIVTAQKREQSLQKVGVAVTALNSDTLKLVNPADATTLAKVVPSLQVNQYSPSQTVYNIRGVSQNDFSDIQEGPVAFYNDEVYIGSLGAIAGQTFDIERIEVLRGPQGTLFGRNATGGLVQMVTAKPTKTWQGYGTLLVGSYDQISAEVGFGGPISDHIRMRLSGMTNYHDGYYRNLNGGRDGGNTRFQALRGQLEFDVGDDGLLRLKAEYLHNDRETSNALHGSVIRQDADGQGVFVGPNEDFFGTGPGANPLGFRPDDEPFTNNSDFDGLFNRSFWNLTARYEHDFGAVQLTSITNYQRLKKQSFLDYDGTPDPLVQGGLDTRLTQISQELRISGSSDRLNWVAGIFGMKIDVDGTSSVVVNPIYFDFAFGLPQNTLFDAINYSAKQKTDTLAAFAQVEYKLTDIFTIIGGLRYSADWKDFRFQGVIDYPNLPFIGLPAATYIYDFNARRPDLTSQTFENWSGKLQINAQLNRDVLLYAGVNRGTKGGGFNTPNTFPTSPGLGFASPTVVDAALAQFDPTMVFDQEVLTNYEAGFKLTLADRRVTVNGAVFHYDYKNYQSFEFIGANGVIFNHPAKVTGAELEITARPTNGVTIGAFANHFFEATVTDVTLSGGAVVDRELPQTPKWSVGGSASLEVPVSSLGYATLATNWKYNSDHYLTVLNPSIAFEKAYVVGDVPVGFQTMDRALDLAFFVNNVTDKVYRINTADNGYATAAHNVYGRPRWLGVSLTYRFGS